MINNLNSNSLMKLQADPSLSGTNDLMSLIGKANPEGGKEELLSLLEGNSSEFNKLLMTQESLTNQTDVLENILNDLVLNKGDVSKIEDLVQKLDGLLTKSESSVDISKLVELVKEKPELQAKISSLLESSDKNMKELSVLKEVTKLVLKDVKTPTTAKNIDEKLNNKAKITKLLGLSSEEILENKNLSKVNNAKVNMAKALKNNFKAESNVIRVPSEEVKSNELKTAMLDIQDTSDSSDNNTNVKLDSSTIIKTNKVNEASKTMDLNQILNSGDTSENVISKIQDYIIQSKVSRDPNVQLTFKHSDLGNIDLNVQKMSGDNISVTITSNSADAVKFFTENKAELLQTLSSAGLNISDLKLESNSSTNKDPNSQNQSFADSKGEFSNSKQGEQDKESKKREELWELFDKEIA